MLDGLTKLGEDTRPFGPRPHDVHVTLDDIQQLGKLIESRLTDQATNRSDSRISSSCPDGAGGSFSIRTHRTKFEDDEWTAAQISRPAVIEGGSPIAPAAIETDTCLSIEDRARRRELDRDCDRYHHWQENDQRNSGNRNIHNSSGPLRSRR